MWSSQDVSNGGEGGPLHGRSASLAACRQAVEEFLCESFSIEELQQLVRHNDLLTPLKKDVAWKGSLSEVAGSFVEVLERNGLLRREFFQILAAAREKKVSDIWQICEKCSVPAIEAAGLSQDQHPPRKTDRQDDRQPLVDEPSRGRRSAAVFTVFLATLGLGSLVVWLMRDRSDLAPVQETVEPGVPLLNKDGDRLQLDGASVFADSARFEFVFAHNRRGNAPIRISRVEVTSTRTDPPAPASVPADSQAGLDYDIDVARRPGFGISNVKRYVIDIWKDRIAPRWIESRDMAIDVTSQNLLDSANAAEAVTVNPSGDDAHYQFKGLIDPKEPGLYHVRFLVHYNVEGGNRRTETHEILVYQK